jgi:hypothetical protein
MKKFAAILIAALVFSFTAVAAEDANGTWKASFDTPGGTMENTFLFKVEDGKVTGTISSQMGTQQITSGSVDGDKIKFSVNSDFGVLSYAGVVKGDDMKLTLTVGDGQFTLDMNAKRVKT